MNYLERHLEPLERLRSRWPQSFIAQPENQSGDVLIVVPGVLLPKGWNKTICTVLFMVNPYSITPVSEFYVDLPDLKLENGDIPKRSCVCGGPWDGAMPMFRQRAGIWDGPPGFPEWKNCRLFLWRQQSFDPNRETIFTSMMVIRERLKILTPAYEPQDDN